jgi:signal transduction histidine kinase
VSDAVPTPERLWLDAMQAIGRPLAHEVRNALNGVAVNLEVVRSRAARPDAPASGVTRFADAAAEQLEVVSGLTDGLLALVRPAPAVDDLASLVRRLAVLLRAVARPDGGDVQVTVGEEPVATGLAGAELRPVVATLLLAAFDRAATLSCEVAAGGPPTLRLARAEGALPTLPEDTRAAVERAGVHLELRPDGWIAVFPPRRDAPVDSNSPGATHA